jgi:hypothetical protein
LTKSPACAVFTASFANASAIVAKSIPVIVSATDFTTVALALANDAVKNATAGDFVKISGDIYLIIKTSPTVSTDLVSIESHRQP